MSNSTVTRQKRKDTALSHLGLNLGLAAQICLGQRRGYDGRHRDNSPNEFPYDICLDDWRAIQQYGLTISVDANNMLSHSPRLIDSTYPSLVAANSVTSWK